MEFYSKATTALTSSHVTFITMTDSTTGKHLRIGGQSNILMYNRESDDATLPNLSPDGIAASTALPTGSFQCLEYHLGTDGTIETWLNGNSISGLQAGPNTSNPYASQWGTAYIPKITGIYFGWESYGGDTNTFWYDDIAIASSRVGCGDTSVTTTARTTGTATPTATTSTTTKATTTTTSTAAAQT